MRVPCAVLRKAQYPLRSLSRPPCPPSPPSPEKAISRTQDGEYSADDDHATDDHATADDDGHHRRLAGGGSDTSDTYDNTGSDGEMTFIVSGWLMLALAIANYIMSRWVELRLLKKAGCEGTREYAERLAVIEKQTLGAKVGLGLGFGCVTPRRRGGRGRCCPSLPYSDFCLRVALHRALLCSEPCPILCSNQNRLIMI